MGKELSVVGKRVPLQDAYEKVTGSLKFAMDVSLPGMLYVKVLRSPYAHARIIKIDTSKAESLPGVGAIITHRDVPQEPWEPYPNANYRQRVIDERVRFVGDEVAAVAAVDTDVAKEALNLIEVAYEELPHIFDVEEAMRPDATQVRQDGNVKPPAIVEWGDLENGFKEADLVVEHRTTMGCQQHAPIQLNACIASWEGDKLTIWTSTQTPFELRDEMARYLKLPQTAVRVIGLPTGGSFGLWWLNNFHFIPVFLAKKARKPVKLELTREEVFSTVKRREIPVSWAKLGVKQDGSFTAIYFKHYFDNGAYGNKNDSYQAVSDLWGGHTPNIKFEMYGVATNLVTAGCMRGVGDLTMNFCMEQLIDKAAEKLGMDPLEIRLKNHIRAGEPLHNRMCTYKDFRVPFPAVILSSCALDECMTKGAEVIRWKERWKGWGQPTEVNGSKRRGLGMAVAMHQSTMNFAGFPSVIVRVNRDGSVYLFTGVGRMGQGSETTQAQIAAEELGVPCESIVGIHGDTEICPWCTPTYGSVAAHQLGRATQAAAADAKRQLCEWASKRLGAKAEDLDIKDGIIYVKEQPERGIPITDITSKPTTEYLSPPTIEGRASLNVPATPIAMFFMAHFVEVEVDAETGKVKILRYVAVHDSGRIINPEVCENQVSGGAMQGCGLALVEELLFDRRTGQVLNPNFVDYKILRSLDMPDPEISFVEPIDPNGPFGAKGIGEAAPCPAPAAVTQAVYNAIGIRFDCVPITPEKILKAWREKQNMPNS